MIDDYQLFDHFHMRDLVEKCGLLDYSFIELVKTSICVRCVLVVLSGERLALALRAMSSLAPALPCFLSCALLIRSG